MARASDSRLAKRTAEEGVTLPALHKAKEELDEALLIFEVCNHPLRSVKRSIRELSTIVLRWAPTALDVDRIATSMEQCSTINSSPRPCLLSASGSHKCQRAGTRG